MKDAWSRVPSPESRVQGLPAIAVRRRLVQGRKSNGLLPSPERSFPLAFQGVAGIVRGEEDDLPAGVGR
jgi:hypothetical protein